MPSIRAVILVTVVAACGGSDEATPPIDAPSPIDAAAIDASPPIDAIDAPPPIDAIDAPLPIDATFDAGNWIDPLDHAFGTDGVITTPDGLPSKVAVDATGRIVILGLRLGATADTYGPGYVERRLSTGAIDPSFDTDGVTDTPINPTSLAVLTDGRIVVGGGAAHGPATDLAYVLDRAGARVGVVPGSDNQAIVAIAAMPDGGFVAAFEQGVFLAQLVTVRRFRADLVTAWTSGQVGVVTSAGAVTLASITTGGTDRVLVTAEGALVSLAAATGAHDGAYAVPSGSWNSSFSGVPLRQVGAQVAMIDRATDAARVRTITVAGTYGPEVLAPSCLPLASFYGTDGAVDSAMRLVLAPPGSQQDQTIAVMRLAPTLDQLDPAWGCGRWFTLPPLCPSGEPCLGTSSDDGAVATGVAIASGDAPVVVGYQRRLHGARRGFVAKLAP